MRAVIIPTGDELKSGVVLDTDGPMIREHMLASFPGAEALLLPPLGDDADSIAGALEKYAPESDIVCFIGGSGSGHLHSPTMGRDYTPGALEGLLEDCASGALFGKNGHMWSKLVCGRRNKALVINVPGPHREAEAAILAFIKGYIAGLSNGELNLAMLSAVKEQYGC